MKNKKHYIYGMRLRPFGIGCQPKDGFLKRMDDVDLKYWDILIYDRELTEKEIFDYDLDYLGESCFGKMANRNARSSVPISDCRGANERKRDE